MLDQSEESNEEIRVSSADAAMLFNGQNSGNSKSRPSETPKNQSKRSSARLTSQSSPHLKRSKQSMFCLRSKEEIETLNRKTSEQVIKSVYHLIKSKFPLNFGKKELSARDQDEIQAFFLKKKSDFTKTLEEIYNSKQATPGKLLRKTYNMEDRLESNIEREILQMKQRKKALKKEILKNVSEKILKEKLLAKNKKKIELRKKEIEERKIQELEKQIIIKNIENFYKDRMVMFKECIKQDQEARKILDYEEKVYNSTIFKEKKQKRIMELVNLKNKYESELEVLKNKLGSL